MTARGWKDGTPPAPLDERCQRCGHPASFLVLSDLETWTCSRCATTERGDAAPMPASPAPTDDALSGLAALGRRIFAAGRA